MQFWGLQKEDNSEKEMEGVVSRNDYDDNSASIPIFKKLPGERKMYDKSNPMMELGSLYPSIKEFKLALRQYAIDNEFEQG
jgi:hypothetical protein